MEFIRHPFVPIHPEIDNPYWHDHICLPLRLGKDVFDAFCPFAQCADLDAEIDDRCDCCKYFMIVDAAEDGTMNLRGDSSVLKHDNGCE